MSVRRPESGDGLVERLWARREARRCTSLPARFFERFGLADPWSEATGSWGRQARGLEARLWSRLGAGLLLGGGFLQALEPAAWLWAWHGVRMGAAWPGLLMDLVFLASPVAFEPEARPARRTRRARRVVLTPPEAPEARSPAVARPPGAPRPGPVPPEAARPGPVPPEAARPGPVP
ncbi:MAG: hypothetical protein JXB39_15380, partial [Deltaproteobacteria bacterium]|nr:hypothetical protein [Deltaproteobacteria bacterium]